MPQLSSPYSHYVSASPMLQVVSPAEAAVNSQLGVVAAAQAGGAGVGGYGAPANKLQRSDRIEVSFLHHLESSRYFPLFFPFCFFLAKSKDSSSRLILSNQTRSPSSKCRSLSQNRHKNSDVLCALASFRV